MSFPAVQYLEQHYSHLNDANITLLHFLHASFNTIPNQSSLLDVGTGPTIYQLISASRNFDSIDCGEFSKMNRVLLKNWRDEQFESKFNWGDWFSYVAKLESSNESHLRKRTIQTIDNIFSLNLLSKNINDHYPAVLSMFCAESIAKNKREFQTTLENITGIVKDEGWLIMGLLRGASYWPKGDKTRSCYPILEDEIVNYLDSKRFLIQYLEINQDAEDFCDGHILLRAKKQK